MTVDSTSTDTTATTDGVTLTANAAAKVKRDRKSVV